MSFITVVPEQAHVAHLLDSIMSANGMMVDRALRGCVHLEAFHPGSTAGRDRQVHHPGPRGEEFETAFRDRVRSGSLPSQDGGAQARARRKSSASMVESRLFANGTVSLKQPVGTSTRSGTALTQTGRHLEALKTLKVSSRRQAHMRDQAGLRLLDDGDGGPENGTAAGPWSLMPSPLAASAQLLDAGSLGRRGFRGHKPEQARAFPAMQVLFAHPPPRSQPPPHRPAECGTPVLHSAPPYTAKRMPLPPRHPVLTEVEQSSDSEKKEGELQGNDQDLIVSMARPVDLQKWGAGSTDSGFRDSLQRQTGPPTEQYSAISRHDDANKPAQIGWEKPPENPPEETLGYA